MDVDKAKLDLNIAKSRKRKLKFYIVLITLLLVCCIVTGTIGAFLWYGGHAQKFMCQYVEVGSALHGQLECLNVNDKISEEGEGEYKYGVLDDKEYVVSDLEQIVIGVVEKSTPSVVGIGIYGNNMEVDRIIGTGFVVTANGLVVTNQHVVSAGEPENYFVVLQDSSDPIKVSAIYKDEINDIALIKINATDLKTLPLGDSNNLKVGQTVIAIGNPLGSLSSTVTVGTISGLNRDVDINTGSFNFHTSTFSDVIQTDAAINPGNSGGPLINSRGEVIGVNFATIRGADNLSFALPINRIKNRIDELNQFGSFRLPYLGVEYRSRVVFINNEAVVGAVVQRILTGGPADQAGLLIGDVILQYDGKSIEDNSLLNLIQQSQIDQEIELVILRDRQTQTITIKVGNRSDYID
jgi:serine protease Do